MLHRPFDDFLREAVVDDAYADYRDREVVLLCDTGHMSRVAGEILAEDLGFTRVLNLRGGMKSWRRWAARTRRGPCGRLASLLACCSPGRA